MSSVLVRRRRIIRPLDRVPPKKPPKKYRGPVRHLGRYPWRDWNDPDWDPVYEAPTQAPCGVYIDAQWEDRMWKLPLCKRCKRAAKADERKRRAELKKLGIPYPE